MSSKSKKIKKPQAFAPDGLLQMRAQLSRSNIESILDQFCQNRMEARIEAVEEELRFEKQKNAALLQQSLLSPSVNPAQSSQDSIATTVSKSSCNGKKTKTAPLPGSGDYFKIKVDLEKRSSQGELEVSIYLIDDIVFI